MAKYPLKKVIKMSPSTQTTRTVKHQQTIPVKDIIREMPKAPRDSCRECILKHVAQAIILISESLLGYPEHKWLAVGHLAEASEEGLKEYPEIAKMLRQDRLDLTNDITPDLMRYLRDDFAILIQDNQ